MAYLALYRKYRPTKFSDVVGQDKVIKVIANAICHEKISHAYLFSGPRGTGKTTTAKIIAKMVNCENLVDGMPCEKCSSCLNILNSSDIVEIDAASNNGVDEIREIRDKVNLVPTNCKYKVYIIDEVHMLTTQAFNALLKTLEEPPSHVLFILATTEFHKIPLTVASRCQKFQFTKIDDEFIVKRLKTISISEKIDIEEDALYEIARLADGGLRDAINLLDQISSYKNELISLEDVYKVNGSVSYSDLYNLLCFVANGNNKDIIEFVEDIDKNGKNINKFIEEIIIFLKDVLIYKNSNTLTKIDNKNDKLVEISKILNDVTIFRYINEFNDLLNRLKTSSYPSILLIVSLLNMSISNNVHNECLIDTNELIDDKNNDIINTVDTKDKNKEREKNIDDSEVINERDDKENIDVDSIDVDIRVNNALATADKNIKLDLISKWDKLSNYLLDDRFRVVVGLLTDASIIVASKEYIIFKCDYESSAERLNELEKDVNRLLFEMYNREFKIVAISESRWIAEKEKYISSINKGINYVIKEEKTNNKESKNTKKTAVDKLVELLGEDIIEYR